MNSNRMIKRRKKIQQKRRANKTELSILDVSEFLVKHKIKNSTELNALTQERKKECNKDSVNFVLSRFNKKNDELLQSIWLIEEATEVLDRVKTSRMEILWKASKKIVLNNVKGCGSSVPVKLSLITIFTCTFLQHPCEI